MNYRILAVACALAISATAYAKDPQPGPNNSQTSQFTGSVATTSADGTGGDACQGNGQNCNIYSSKDLVYLVTTQSTTGGGPTVQYFNVPDGAYYFQVTNTPAAGNSFQLLSTDPAKCRQVIVQNGSIQAGVAVAGCDPANHTLTDIVQTIDSVDTVVGKRVQLMPFDDTPNPGGEYKAWLIATSAVTGCGTTAPVTPDSSVLSWANDSCVKTDNFKIKEAECVGDDCGPPDETTYSIGGFKWYDTTPNGTFENGEPTIAGFKINVTINGNPVTPQIYTSSDTATWGTWTVEGLLDGDQYLVCEQAPSMAWLQTNPLQGDDGTQIVGAEVCYSGTIQSANVTGLDFGNVLLGKANAFTLGYWSNKNGQAQLKNWYGAHGGNGGKLPPGITDAGVCDTSTMLPIVNGAGTLQSFTWGGYTSFRSWLLAATATNMAYMLSAQNSAMQLNRCVANDPTTFSSTWMFVGTPNAYCVSSGLLQMGDVTAAGFVQVGTLIARSAQAVTNWKNTTSGGPAPIGARSCQEWLKNQLDSGNNALNVFVQDPVDQVGPY